MKSYTAAATIQADPEKIWEILTDAATYPEWDNGITNIEGSISPEAKIILHTANDKHAHQMTITDVEPGRRMVWVEGMPLGLFKEVRTFRLLSEQAGTTRFSMSEDLSGPLTMFKRRSPEDVQAELDRFADGLKQAAEAA